MSEKIKFKFEELQYQNDAVNSVIDLLNGIDRYSINSIYSNKSVVRQLYSLNPEANVRFSISPRLIDNLQKVQYRNGLFKDDKIIGDIPQFSIEMETGTGKTFVYLKTILSLWQEYGGQFKKFMIVVPSNPILLGVKKSIEMFSDYFKPQFQNIDISKHFFVYDKNCSVETVSDKFIENVDLSIMLITYQSFNKETNRLNIENESNIIVWNDIKDIAPIVIIDEPQKLDGTSNKKSKALKKLEELNPAMILRYSATHKNLYNLIYKLDSYKAYQEHFVKGIKVTTIHSLTPKEFPYVRYIGMTPELKAKIEIFSNRQKSSIKLEKFDVDINSSLEKLSGGLSQYKNWYISEQPNKIKPLAISCDDGKYLYLEKGESNDKVDPKISIEMQMRIAIETHLKKQIEILNSGYSIKALALFFVDSVSKVRSDKEDGRGEYLVLFDKLFSEIREKLMMQPNIQYAYKTYPKELAILNPEFPISEIREGYFAIDKNKKVVEIDNWNSNINDEDISFNIKTQENIDRGIDLILNKKDELITFEEPLTFIFSHSALREGWDNPNVFTIVTLKQGGSDIAKKQEVGRGLRLPVDIYGCRCKADDINELNIIANDFYDQFSEALQNDYNNSIGFNKNEISSDIVKQSIIKAGVPKDKFEEAFDAFRQEIIDLNIGKIDENGKVMLNDKIKNIHDIVFNRPILYEHSEKIIESFLELMTDKGSKRIPINNGDEGCDLNGFQKYINDDDFNYMYKTMLKILQKRSVYRYKFDKDKFINETSEELNKSFSKMTDKMLFEVTDARVEFNSSKRMKMSDAQIKIEENENFDIEYSKRSIFEITNYIMYNTMLPRLAIIKIIQKLNDISKIRINSQDGLENAVKTINKILAKYKSENFINAEIIDGIGAHEKEIFEFDKIIDKSNTHYFFKPNPSHRKALNLKYNFDSQGELDFAKALDEDINVLMYTKLKKGGFVIETPIGNYSPDWAIVYRNDKKNVEMYFIAETKWNKEYDNLTNDEKIKIRCAKKHFKAINNEFEKTIKYEWVNSYKNTIKSNSFPQIFLDDNFNKINYE